MLPITVFRCATGTRLHPGHDVLATASVRRYDVCIMGSKTTLLRTLGAIGCVETAAGWPRALAWDKAAEKASPSVVAACQVVRAANNRRACCRSGRKGWSGCRAAPVIAERTSFVSFAASGSYRRSRTAARKGCEVEAVEALHGRELGRFDAALDHAALAIDQLQLGEPQQITRIVDAFGGALARHLVILAQDHDFV